MKWEALILRLLGENSIVLKKTGDIYINMEFFMGSSNQYTTQNLYKLDIYLSIKMHLNIFSLRKMEHLILGFTWTTNKLELRADQFVLKFKVDGSDPF